MGVVVKEHVNGTSGAGEYDFVDFPFRDGFEILERILVEQQGCGLLEKLDGIWFVQGVFEHKGLRFKLVWHEDVGHTAAVLDASTDNHRQLGSLLRRVVESLSKYLPQE